MSKKKKEKIIYYDDNSTISDMSNVTSTNGRKKTSPPPQVQRTSTAKEKWKTYWSAVKMLFLPMCVVLLILGVLYLLCMLLIGGF